VLSRQRGTVRRLVDRRRRRWGAAPEAGWYEVFLTTNSTGDGLTVVTPVILLWCVFFAHLSASLSRPQRRTTERRRSNCRRSTIGTTRQHSAALGRLVTKTWLRQKQSYQWRYDASRHPPIVSVVNRPSRPSLSLSEIPPIKTCVYNLNFWHSL